jgi:hypothetical protein
VDTFCDFTIFDQIGSVYARQGAPAASLSVPLPLSDQPTHRQSDLIQCLWDSLGCGQWISRWERVPHIRAAHGVVLGTKTACRWAGCRSQLSTLASWHAHMKKHAGELEAACAVCGKTLGDADALKRHRARGWCARCLGCGRSFATAEQRRAHMHDAQMPTCKVLPNRPGQERSVIRTERGRPGANLY